MTKARKRRAPRSAEAATAKPARKTTSAAQKASAAKKASAATTTTTTAQKARAAKTRATKAAKTTGAANPLGAGGSVVEAKEAQIDALREDLERRFGQAGAKAAPRWNADPEDVQRSVAKLVLTLVEFLRKLMERQAIRRMEAGTLDDEETEKVGLALMRLEKTIVDLCAHFGLEPEELKLDLGPLGKLL